MKRTFQPSNIKRKRVHGFRKRSSTVGGRRVLANRRRKGRKRLTVWLRRTSAGNGQSLYFADKEFWSLDGPLLSGSTPSRWMKNFSFKKKERLAKRPEFEKVMAEGRKKRIGKLCIIFSLPNELGKTRLGIIASKKVGNAVARNRVKRRIRETFRQIKHRIEPALDIVVISGKDIVTLPYRMIEKELSNALLTKRWIPKPDQTLESSDLHVKPGIP